MRTSLSLLFEAMAFIASLIPFIILISILGG